MVIGLFSAEVVLGSIGAIATLTGLFYRYVWGSKSHVSVSRFATIDDSEWRDGRTNGMPIWTRRILIKVANNGWRDGTITQIELDEVVLTGEFGQTTVDNPEEGVYKIELEYFSESGESTRLSLQQRTSYDGQIIGGRDDAKMGIIPFILRESELGEMMRDTDEGTFRFIFTIEDNKRTYSTSVEVSTPLEDSSGGSLNNPVQD